MLPPVRYSSCCSWIFSTLIVQWQKALTKFIMGSGHVAWQLKWLWLKSVLGHHGMHVHTHRKLLRAQCSLLSQLDFCENPALTLAIQCQELLIPTWWIHNVADGQWRQVNGALYWAMLNCCLKGDQNQKLWMYRQQEDLDRVCRLTLRINHMLKQKSHGSYEMLNIS